MPGPNNESSSSLELGGIVFATILEPVEEFFASRLDRFNVMLRPLWIATDPNFRYAALLAATTGLVA